MQVIELGADYWTVYAVCSDEDTCSLLDFVQSLERKLANKVLADLQQFVPSSTPRDWVRMEFSKQLKTSKSILEFRWPTNRGGTPRVYWFYDEKHTVVCSHGVYKKGKTDAQDIRTAEQAHADFLKARRTGSLKIVKYGTFVGLGEE